MTESFFRVDKCFDFIMASAENSAYHKYLVQNGKDMSRALSEIVGNSVLFPD